MFSPPYNSIKLYRSYRRRKVNSLSHIFEWLRNDNALRIIANNLEMMALHVTSAYVVHAMCIHSETEMEMMRMNMVNTKKKKNSQTRDKHFRFHPCWLAHKYTTQLTPFAFFFVGWFVRCHLGWPFCVCNVDIWSSSRIDAILLLSICRAEHLSVHISGLWWSFAENNNNTKAPAWYMRIFPLRNINAYILCILSVT